MARATVSAKRTLKWLAHADNRIERFTISADMSPQLAQACAAVPNAQSQLLEERTNEVIWWAEVEFTPGDWPKAASPLRYLVRRIEKLCRPHADLLAPEATRKHLAIVSNDRTTPAPALLAWHDARARTIEKLHAVVKNELGGGVLPCAELGANAAFASVVPATPRCGAVSSGSCLRTVAPLPDNVQRILRAEEGRLARRVRRRTAEARQ